MKPKTSVGDSDSDTNVEEEQEESSCYDSQLEAAAWEESLARVDDEDWEIAEGGAYKFCPQRLSSIGTQLRKQISQNLIID